MKYFNKAQWIGLKGVSPIVEKGTPAPYLRKAFSLDKEVQQAKLYITGLGYYEAYTNGKEVTDTVLNPAFTNYNKSVMYQVYDITNLKQGDNVIAVILGNGFYNASTLEVWDFVTAPWRDEPKLILNLVVTYKDGTTKEIYSDGDFKGSTGPIIFNEVRNGTVYDARLELGNWNDTAFDDSSWDNVKLVPAPTGVLKEQTHLPIKVMRTFDCTINKISDSVWVYDIGMNTAGFSDVQFTDNEGVTVTMQYGERLYDTGRLDVDKLSVFVKSGEFQKDTYISNGNGVQKFRGQFAYHGYRYIEVQCNGKIPDDFTLTPLEVRSAMEERGGFSCSDETMNALQSATIQATKTNMHGIPTDCPHREKNGWTGDAQLSAEHTLLNLNPMSIYSRWMEDFIDTQSLAPEKMGQIACIIPTTGWGSGGAGPAWDSAIVIIPYMQYLYCDDKSIIETMYEPMKKLMVFMESMATDCILSHGIGDWCCPQEMKGFCDFSITDTSYYYYDLVTIAKIAIILGFEDDARIYSEKANCVKKAFRDKFITDVKTAKLSIKPCQTAYACMMYQGLLEEDEKPVFFNALIEQIKADNMLTTSGILGAKFVYNVLCDYGRADIVYDMITTTQYPSLGNMIANGATTLWEDFEGAESLNHHMYGDISAVFYKYFAGMAIDESNVGFKNTIFAPQFIDALSHAEAHHESSYGTVSISWERAGENEIDLFITVPQGCTGELRLPNGYKLKEGNNRLVQGKTHLIVLCE